MNFPAIFFRDSCIYGLGEVVSESRRLSVGVRAKSQQMEGGVFAFVADVVDRAGVAGPPF